jgi:hypothetical protein
MQYNECKSQPAFDLSRLIVLLQSEREIWRTACYFWVFDMEIRILVGLNNK